MPWDNETALSLVKTRLNRMLTDTTLDSYLTTIVQASREELERIGITLQADSTDDLFFLVNIAVWKYQNRDSPTAMPPWLAQNRRERWLKTNAT